jgi:hypothetical protein
MVTYGVRPGAVRRLNLPDVSRPINVPKLSMKRAPLNTNFTNKQTTLTTARPTPSTGRGRPSIGNYVLGKTIGEGTFGKVKLGTHLLTGEFR